MSLQASLDISMYPLHEEYCEDIIAFIERLKQSAKVHVVQNTMSTQVFGNYHDIMDLLTEEVEKVLQNTPKTMFILKLIGTDRSESSLDRCSD